ncbi:hypothetical protein [Nitrospira sp. Nam74]
MAPRILFDSFPRRLFALLGVLLLTAWSGVILHAEEVMYRCEDGSFTNHTETACPPYHAQSSMAVSPDGQPPVIFRDRLKGDSSIMSAVLPPPSGKVSKTGVTLCGLYEEWDTLRRTTNGGMVFSRSRDVARWQALSRLFLSLGTPQCEVPPTIRAAQASR